MAGSLERFERWWIVAADWKSEEVPPGSVEEFVVGEEEDQGFEGARGGIYTSAASSPRQQGHMR